LNTNQALVAHTCNPSYSGGRDQENHGSTPDREDSSRDPTLKTKQNKKNPSQKRDGRVTQGVGPEFKPQYHKNKKSWTLK
jgi:hypothetical protein